MFKTLQCEVYYEGDIVNIIDDGARNWIDYGRLCPFRSIAERPFNRCNIDCAMLQADWELRSCYCGFSMKRTDSVSTNPCFSVITDEEYKKYYGKDN